MVKIIYTFLFKNLHCLLKVKCFFPKKKHFHLSVLTNTHTTILSKQLRHVTRCRYNSKQTCSEELYNTTSYHCAVYAYFFYLCFIHQVAKTQNKG